MEHHQGFGCDCCIFDYTGLVYDGNFPPDGDGCNASDPYDRGSGVKKLAYYSMALLVQTLDGATSVSTQPGSETARIYRFTTDRGFVLVAWSEAEGGETVYVDTGAANWVGITDAVPAAEFGDDVDDPATAFPTREEAVSGSVFLDLGQSPVFVEEIRLEVPGSTFWRLPGRGAKSSELLGLAPTRDRQHRLTWHRWAPTMGGTDSASIDSRQGGFSRPRCLRGS